MNGGKPPTADNVVEMVEGLLARAVAQRASDVHFEPAADGLRVRLRIDGLLRDVDRIPSYLAENVIGRLKVLAGLLTYRTDIPQEGSFQLPVGGAGALPVDVRVATFPTIRRERAVVRFLYVTVVSGLSELGLTLEAVQALERAARRPHGLILVTGPAGSGKSTTLYALARHILATTPERSVVSLEDPVEQRVEGMAQMQVTPHGELDYVRAMRSLLRQDVQVMLVGEIRDAETAHVVVEASLTGHLIMSTMHSGDTAEAISRLLEMGIAPYQVVGGVSVVCAQRLLRMVCEACSGKGCEACVQTGYRGRTACGQVVCMDEPLREAVLEHRPASGLRALLQQRGADLQADAERLVHMGRTTREEVARVVGK